MSATIATTAKRAYGTVVPLVRRLRTWLLYAWVADDHRRWVARRDQLQRQLLEARLQAAFYGEWRAELMNQLVPHPSRPNTVRVGPGPAAGTGTHDELVGGTIGDKS